MDTVGAAVVLVIASGLWTGTRIRRLKGRSDYTVIGGNWEIGRLGMGGLGEVSAGRRQENRGRQAVTAMENRPT